MKTSLIQCFFTLSLVLTGARVAHASEESCRKAAADAALDAFIRDCPQLVAHSIEDVNVVAIIPGVGYQIAVEVMGFVDVPQGFKISRYDAFTKELGDGTCLASEPFLMRDDEVQH